MASWSSSRNHHHGEIPRHYTDSARKRTTHAATYPIPSSRYGYTGSPGTAGVTKHYITEFNWSDMQVLYLGIHFLAYPTDTLRCAEREAQATVIHDYCITNWDLNSTF